MAGTDHSIILDRLIEMIRADATLWTDDLALKKGKLLAVKFGEPEYNTLDARQMPYCYVATPSNMMEDTRNSFGSSAPGTSQPYQSTYQIGVVCQNNKTEDTQRQLYNFLKIIRDVIEANPRLGDPGDITTDTKVIRTRISSVERLVAQRGKETDIGIITIQCHVGPQSTATVTGGLVLDLLSFNAPEGFNFDENLTDDQLRCVDPSSDRGSWLLEYENTPTNDAAIRAILGTIGTFTLTRFGVSRIIKVAYITITPSARLDEIERAVLHLEKTQ